MKVCISAEELYELLCGRITRGGLVHWNRGTTPAPPENLFKSGLDLSVVNAEAPHVCELEPTPEIPPFLVLPLQDVIRVEQPEGPRFCSDAKIEPYWICGARLTHFSSQWPGDGYRMATELECLCAIAQYPRYGSFRTNFLVAGWKPSTVEACYWHVSSEQRRLPRLHASDCLFFGQNHHRLFVPTAGLPEFARPFGPAFVEMAGG